MVARKPAGPEPCGRAGRGKRRAETWNGRAETARPTIVPPMSQGERNLLVPRRDLRTWARARQDDQEDQEGRHRHRAGTQGPQGEVTMNKRDGSTIDSLFEELGELEEVNARTAKKILAIETERRMKKLGLSTTDLARRMGTSRNQIHRILDEGDAGITLKMLFRLAGALGMPLQVGFGPPGLERAHVRSSKGLRCASIGQRAGEGICSILYGVQPPWAGRSTGSTEALTMVRRAHRTESGRRDLNPRRPPWQEGGRQSGSGEKQGDRRSGCPPGCACDPPPEPADRCDGRCDRPLAGVQWCTDRRGAFAVCGSRSRPSIAAPRRRSERSRVAGVARPRLTPARRVHGPPTRVREALRQRPHRARCRACAASLNANEGTMS